MIQSKPNRPQNDRSIHLRDHENNAIIDNIVSQDGVTLATAIIQLYLSQKPDHSRWTKYQTGIICFVKDFSRKSYFFRLFSLNASQSWEQEMYSTFSYHKLTSNFHYFAADVCFISNSIL